MKRQPLNILLGPAQLAPRTIPPLIELVLLFQVPAFFHAISASGDYGTSGLPVYDSKAVLNRIGPQRLYRASFFPCAPLRAASLYPLRSFPFGVRGRSSTM